MTDFFRAWGSEAEQRPEGADISAIVAGAVNGSFGEERALGAAKRRMIQDARKGLPANLAAADVLVTITARAQRGFGIIAVHDADVFQAEGGIGFRERAVETLGRADFESGGEQMRRVQTDAGSGRDAAGAAAFQQAAEMTEFGCETSSLPRRVFKEDADGTDRRGTKGRLFLAFAEVLREAGATVGAGDGFSDCFDAAVDAGITRGAGMHDQIFGAQLRGTNQFVAKGFDRVLPLARVRSGQIDQIVGMNGDRAEAKRGPALAEALGDVSGDLALVRTRPHARAAGKNLKRGATDACGDFKSVGGIAGDGGVNPDAGAPIKPCGRGGRGLCWFDSGSRIDFDVLRVAHCAE